MKITRRKLAATALASAAAFGQTPPAPSDNPEELLQAARDQVRRNGEVLAKVAVPVTAEPAFQFKP